MVGTGGIIWVSGDSQSNYRNRPPPSPLRKEAVGVWCQMSAHTGCGVTTWLRNRSVASIKDINRHRPRPRQQRRERERERLIIKEERDTATITEPLGEKTSQPDRPPENPEKRRLNSELTIQTEKSEKPSGSDQSDRQTDGKDRSSYSDDAGVYRAGETLRDRDER